MKCISCGDQSDATSVINGEGFESPFRIGICNTCALAAVSDGRLAPYYELEDAVSNFLKSNHRSQWLGEGTTKIYLRREFFSGSESLAIAAVQTADLSDLFDAINIVVVANPYPYTTYETPVYKQVVDGLLCQGWNKTTIDEHGVMGNLYLNRDATEDWYWDKLVDFVPDDGLTNA